VIAIIQGEVKLQSFSSGYIFGTTLYSYNLFCLVSYELETVLMRDGRLNFLENIELPCSHEFLFQISVYRTDLYIYLVSSIVE